MSDKDEKSEWRITIENWMVNEGPKYLFTFTWFVVNVFLFWYAFNVYKTPPWLPAYHALGYSLCVARGAAKVIDFNCGIILLTVCRNLITVLRNTFVNSFIPLDKNITFHKLVAWTILVSAILHVGSHFFNFLHIQNDFANVAVPPNGLPKTAIEAAFTTTPGITGHLINLVMMLMYTAALEPMRMKYFEVFWYSHHLFIAFFVLLMIHPSACLVATINYGQVGICMPEFWWWFIGSGFIYLIERLVREIRARRETYISKVVQHPSKVFEIQMKKPSMSYKPGQYLFLNCPDVGFFQWHPITISSAPEEDFVSVHIRVVGDWTSELAKRLGCKFDDKEDPQAPSSLPRMMIDGPFGSASEDVFKFEVAVLVGAGIGVTPFSSILKSIWYKVINPQTVMKMRKCYFYWVCRDTQAFEWFQDLLEALEAEDVDNFLEIHMFLTGGLKADEVRNVVMSGADGRDAVTGLKSPTHFGRPDFDRIFKKMAEDHPSTDVGIFFCGPKPLSRTLHKAANRNTSSKAGGTKFYYHKENF